MVDYVVMVGIVGHYWLPVSWIVLMGGGLNGDTEKFGLSVQYLDTSLTSSWSYNLVLIRRNLNLTYPYL